MNPDQTASIVTVQSGCTLFDKEASITIKQMTKADAKSRLLLVVIGTLRVKMVSY